MRLNLSSIFVLLAAIAAFSLTGCRTPPPVDTNGPGGPGSDTINIRDWVDGDDPLGGWDHTQMTQLTPAETGVFVPVYFAYNAHNIANSEAAKVHAVATFLDANKHVFLLIGGHCDERGTTEYNISLGERRALNVRENLMALGIAPNRVQTVSYGKEKPVDFGHSEAAWSKNRRAEFTFYISR